MADRRSGVLSACFEEDVSASTAPQPSLKRTVKSERQVSSKT